MCKKDQCHHCLYCKAIFTQNGFLIWIFECVLKIAEYPDKYD